MELSITLTNFEGPLFLLHHQIKKQEIDIFDIQITTIATYCLTHVFDGLSNTEQSIDKGGELIFFITTFLLWKSQKLLPKEEKEETLPEEESDIFSQFIEYSRVKEIANDLSELEKRQLPYFVREVLFIPEEQNSGLEEVHLNDLSLLFQKMMARYNPVVEELNIAEAFDITSKMEWLMTLTGKYLPFEEVFSLEKRKEELIVLFLALLELIKLQRISLMKENNSFYIKICR